MNKLTGKLINKLTTALLILGASLAISRGANSATIEAKYYSILETFITPGTGNCACQPYTSRQDDGWYDPLATSPGSINSSHYQTLACRSGCVLRCDNAAYASSKWIDDDWYVDGTDTECVYYDGTVCGDCPRTGPNSLQPYGFVKEQCNFDNHSYNDGCGSSNCTWSKHSEGYYRAKATGGGTVTVKVKVYTLYDFFTTFAIADGDRRINGQAVDANGEVSFSWAADGTWHDINISGANHATGVTWGTHPTIRIP